MKGLNLDTQSQEHRNRGSVVAHFERTRQVRLQAMFVPDPAHALLTETSRFRHRAGAPPGRVGRVFLRGFPDHRGA